MCSRQNKSLFILLPTGEVVRIEKTTLLDFKLIKEVQNWVSDQQVEGETIAENSLKKE